MLLLFVCFLAATLFAQNTPAPAKGSVQPNRFLFIVDTSASMERHARDVQQLVMNILSSSASGQMHRGDTLGVWTFNADVYTGNIPLQRWTPDDWWQIASRTSDFLRQQHYGKKSRLDKALADMHEVITNSDIITIILISNGEGKMQGTPFDADINAIYKESLKEMKKDRLPVITVLQAKGGKIIKYTVNAFPWPVVIPEVPIVIKKVQTLQNQPSPLVVQQKPASAPQPNAIAATTTLPPVTQPPPQNAPPPNPPPSVSTAAPVVNTPPPQPTPSAPVVTAPPPVVKPQSPPANAIAPSSVPLPSRQAKANTEPASPPPAPPVQSVIVKPPEPTVAAARPVIVPVPPVTPAAPAVSTAVPSNIPSAPSKPAQVAGANSAADSSNLPATNSPAVQATAVLPPGANGRPKLFLIAGLALVAIALGLIVLLVRRARSPSGPSLITTSMDNRKK